MLDVVLHAGRDRSVRRRHPWLWSGSVARVDGDPLPGAWVRVRSSSGEVLGHGQLAPDSNLRVRLLAFGKEAPDEGLIARRIEHAVARRRADSLLGDTDAVRLINAEGDGLPGLVVDRYGDVVVAKLASAGMSACRPLIAEALRAATGAATGFERADSAAARREGIAAQQGPLWGDPPAGPVRICERGRVYSVDVVAGQKTGFYLDQRDTRDCVQSLAAGRRVLDLFAYTGGFAVAAARGGADTVTLVESSPTALEGARKNLGMAASDATIEFVGTDAFRFLRQEAPTWDLCVVDPPPLARQRRDVDRAARAHKDILLQALRCAAPEALLFAFSCSHHIGPELLRKIVFGAALDAGRPLQLLRILGTPPDHPVSIDHPEGSYLSGLLLRA
jgi:23S rRNA (cytosine1962-C5)-methyltransferase